MAAATMMATATTTAKRRKPVYDDEKAGRLIRVYGSIVWFCLLLCWLEIMILRPSISIGIEMKHMDPTEIIGVPFPLVQVLIFTLLPVLILMIFWTVVDPSTVIWKVLSFTKVTGFMFILFGLCGNYLVENCQHSILAALYVSTLLCTNLTEKRSSNILEELPFYDQSDLLATCRLYCTLAFVIPFSILSVLDHGSQMQRWPVPVLMGSTYGIVFGSFIGITLSYFQNKKKDTKK